MISRYAMLLMAAALVPACNGDTASTTVEGGGPEWPPAGTAVVLSGGANVLHFFSPADPTTITNSVAIAGLEAGYNLVSIDYRPQTRLLCGLALNGTNGR